MTARNPITAAFVLWGLAVVAGVGEMTRYELAEGATAGAPVRWPVESTISPARFGATVVMFVSVEEMRMQARNLTDLEALNASIERKVESRTRALSDAKDRFRALVENIEAVPFEYDVAAQQVLYIAPQASRILQRELVGDALFGNVYPDDTQRVRETLVALGSGALKAASIDYRAVDPERQIVHLRVVASAKATNRVHGVALDITKQAKLEQELRQAQKLESVGRLAAGVAYEINTPIQFVNDSVRFLQTAVEDVMVVISRHQSATRRTLDGAPGLELAHAAIAAEVAVDLPFLVLAMPEAIDRAVVGIDRVAAIVRSIKAFAHPDTAHMTNVDLNAAIANTLIVASGEYKYIADLDSTTGKGTTFVVTLPIEQHVREAA